MKADFLRSMLKRRPPSVPACGSIVSSLALLSLEIFRAKGLRTIVTHGSIFSPGLELL
jgi:hypothetical protein